MISEWNTEMYIFYLLILYLHSSFSCWRLCSCWEKPWTSARVGSFDARVWRRIRACSASPPSAPDWTCWGAWALRSDSFVRHIRVIRKQIPKQEEIVFVVVVSLTCPCRICRAWWEADQCRVRYPRCAVWACEPPRIGARSNDAAHFWTSPDCAPPARRFASRAQRSRSRTRLAKRLLYISWQKFAKRKIHM